MLEILHKVDQFLNDFASLGRVGFASDFLLSSVVAYLSFPLHHLYRFGKDASLLDQIEKISQQSRGLRNALRWFTFRYAVCTGFLTVAIIALQYQAPNWKYAIIYGFLGPFFVSYAVSEKLRGGLQQGVTGLVESWKDQVEEIPRKANAEYKSGLYGIIADIAKGKIDGKEEPKDEEGTRS